MTGKRLLSIIVGILVVGGLVMFFSLNGDKQMSKEEQRNREYEVSLVRALKNSYRDIEEIYLSSPHRSEKPGNWSCTVQLTFSDGQVVKYTMGHSLYDDINRSAVVNGAEADILSAHYGTTESEVKVVFSNGEEVTE